MEMAKEVQKELSKLPMSNYYKHYTFHIKWQVPHILAEKWA